MWNSQLLACLSQKFTQIMIVTRRLDVFVLCTYLQTVSLLKKKLTYIADESRHQSPSYSRHGGTQAPRPDTGETSLLYCLGNEDAQGSARNLESCKITSPALENCLPHCSLTPYTHINTTALPPQNKLRQTILTLPEAMLFLLIRRSCFSHISIRLYNSYLKFLPQLYSHF